MYFFFLQSSSAGYVFYGNRDIAGALVVSLGLLAIAQQQSNLRFIHWTAFVFFVFSIVGTARAIVSVIQERQSANLTGTDEENTPIVS